MSDLRAERRQHERVEILGELHGEVTVFQSIVVREIGLGGAGIETTFPLQLNSLHEFRLSLGDRSVVMKGRVAHCRIGDVHQELLAYWSGIEFVEPSDPVLAVLTGFIESIKAGRRSKS